MNRLFAFVAFVALVATVHGHICLIYPAQRGGAVITGPGSSDCYQPQAPCGTVPPAEPDVTFIGGTYVAVLFQQNLNHYNPGFPGFLDVAWAQGYNQSSDSDFTELELIPDYWPHLQSQQTNFSVNVLVPNIDCDHCTLRVRYHSNKLEEPLNFHNCADIKIISSVRPTATQGTVVANLQSGPAYGRYNAQNTIVNVTATGDLVSIDHFNSGVRSVSVPFYQSQGLSAAYPGQWYFIGGPTENFTVNTAPNTLIRFSVNNGGSTQQPIYRPSNVQQWTSLVATGNSTYPFIIVGIIPSGSQFIFAAYYLNTQGQVTGPLASSAPQQTYVNVLWGDYDTVNNIFYLLNGDEDSLYAMKAQLFTFNLGTGAVSSVNVANNVYTISTIIMDSSTNTLYSLSAGLHGVNGAWTLLKLNPATGALTAGPVIAKAGLFVNNYWGGVYGSSFNTTGNIYHVFQTIAGGLVMAAIDPATGAYTTTGINTGINNQHTLSGYTYVPAG